MTMRILIIALAFTLISAKRAGAINCDTNCWATCRVCTKILGEMVCSPPEPTCYGACLSAKGLICTYEATRKDEPIHGVYCGYGNKDPSYQTPPIDALDGACKRHDQCWDSRGRGSCSCDKTLSAEASAVAAFGGHPPSVREKAAGVASFFLSTPCLLP